jgi:hypothetical protein
VVQCHQMCQNAAPCVIWTATTSAQRAIFVPLNTRGGKWDGSVRGPPLQAPPSTGISFDAVPRTVDALRDASPRRDAAHVAVAQHRDQHLEGTSGGGGGTLATIVQQGVSMFSSSFPVGDFAHAQSVLARTTVSAHICWFNLVQDTASHYVQSTAYQACRTAAVEPLRQLLCPCAGYTDGINS